MVLVFQVFQGAVWSHDVLKQGMVTGADAAVVGADKQLRLSTEKLGEIHLAFPDGRRTTAGFQLRPRVTDDHCDRQRQRHVQL